MLNKIFSILIAILPSILSHFLSKREDKKEEEKAVNKQQDINFQSEVEEVVAKAKNENTKSDALNRVRELLSE